MLININWVRIFTEREFIFRGAINKNTDSIPTYCDVLVHGRDISSVKNKKQKTSVSRKVKIKTRPGNRCHLPKYLLMILKIHPVFLIRIAACCWESVQVNWQVIFLRKWLGTRSRGILFFLETFRFQACFRFPTISVPGYSRSADLWRLSWLLPPNIDVRTGMFRKTFSSLVFDLQPSL